MTNHSSLSLSFDDQHGVTKIKVIGVGGAGNNALNCMSRSGIKGVEMIAMNTDAQDLQRSEVGIKLQLGISVTRGMGAGTNPVIGRQSAIESNDMIMEQLDGSDMVFITTGLGGGTGTGAAPVIAALCQEMGILSVAVVTMPFRFEGKRRMDQAIAGFSELIDSADACLMVKNNHLLDVYKKLSIMQAFAKSDEVLVEAVRGISELITETGYINLDFADVRTVMKNSGRTMWGTGFGSGEGAAVKAMNDVFNCPLLENSSVLGAGSVIINITGNSSTVLEDIEEAIKNVEEKAHPEANIIFGVRTADEVEGVSIMMIATSFQKTDEEILRQDVPDEIIVSSNMHIAMTGTDGAAAAGISVGAAGILGDGSAEINRRAYQRRLAPERRDTAVSSFNGASPQAHSSYSTPPPATTPAHQTQQPQQARHLSYDSAMQDGLNASTPGKMGVDGDDDMETPAFIRRQRSLD